MEWYGFVYASAWTIGSVIIGVAVGYYLRGSGGKKEEEVVTAKTAETRDTTLRTLAEILKSVERLTREVGAHDTEMREVGRHVGELRVTGELEDMQDAILTQIGVALESTQKMKDDLVVARYQMENKAQELDRTRREARVDPVSGVGNRMAFDEALEWLLTAWKRDREPFVLILADVDRFKWINDTHGHPVGDRVLNQLGSLLRQCMRGGDIVTRFGGDEFAILLPRTELAAGNQVAARFRHQIWRTSFQLGKGGEQGIITLSVGVAACRDGDTAESLIARADRALYKAKEMGRNRVYSLSGSEREPQPVELVGQM